VTRLGKRPVHQSLIRPALFGGTEQGMAVLTLIAVVGIPMYGGFLPVTIALGFLVGLPLHALGVSLAKKDAQMVALLVRSLWARDSYLPHGAGRTRAPAVRPSIPGAR
jgi:type IV secretory pathway TrbD component